MPVPNLTADCSACTALCCVATAFDASDDFAFDKAAGEKCPHVTVDHRCGIHDARPDRGFSGCVAYDCYGAGQRAAQAFRFAERHVQSEAFLVLKNVHELLWLLTKASSLCPSTHAELSVELAAMIASLEVVAAGDAVTLAALPFEPHHGPAHALLRRVGDALGGRARLASRRPVPETLVPISRLCRRGAAR